MKKALLLTYNFPPNNSVGAQRPSSWDKYFPKYGVSTVTITYDWGNLDSSEITGEVIQVKCPNSEVDDIALTGFKKIMRKAGTLINLFFRFKSIKLDDKYEIFLSANEYLKENPVDFIIATGEPFILFKYASVLSDRYDIPWFADYRDDWIDRHIPVVPNRIINRLILNTEVKQEQKFLRNASGVFTVSETLLGQIQRRLPSIQGCVIENGADLALYEDTKSPYPDNTFVIAYTGILYDLPYFEPFFDGFSAFMESVQDQQTIKVYFIGTEGHQNQATNKLAELQLKFPYNIEILPRKNPKEIAAFQQHAHVLLNLIAGDPSLGLIGAKSYNYAITRNPILTIPHILTKKSSFFPERDIQYLAINAKEVDQFIGKHYSNFLDQTDVKTSISDQEIYSLSREFNAEKLVSFVHDNLANK